MPIPDLEQTLRDDVALIRATPLIAPDIEVAGFVYDVRDGSLNPVDVA